MTKTAFIAGASAAFAAAAPKRNAVLATEVSPAASGTLFCVPWHPSSPVSARTALVAAENHSGQIFESLIVFDAPSLSARYASFASARASEALDTMLLGPLLLSQEILAYYEKKQSGLLVFIRKYESQPNENPLTAMAERAFCALAETLARHQTSAYRVLLFASPATTTDEALSRAVFTRLDARAGKLATLRRRYFPWQPLR
jgi:hypothetical protein